MNVQKIILLLVGIVFIALGIAGAWWSRKYQQRQREKNPQKLSARYGFVYGIWFGAIFVLMGIRFIMIIFN